MVYVKVVCLRWSQAQAKTIEHTDQIRGSPLENK